MSDNTSIEWADATWNPLTGCTKITKGCENCYASTFAERFRGTPGHYFETGFDLKLRPDKLDLPLRWKKSRKVFVTSMGDLFHKDVPTDFIHQVLAVMAATPQHTYQILTKRAPRMRSILRDECRCTNAGHQPGVHITSAIDWVATPHSPLHIPGLPKGLYHQIQWPLPNVWVGVSVEDQTQADRRIPALRETPAAVRWLSCEPLLGPVDLSEHLVAAEAYPAFSGNAWDRGDLAWIVAGGESGHGARPMHPDWARTLRDQAVAAEVPFFFKQWGEHLPVDVFADPTMAGGRAFRRPGGGTSAAVIREVGPSGTMRTAVTRPMVPGDRAKGGELLDDKTFAVRVGKKAAGRVLDGREWNEFPGDRNA